jgi:tetratricopeptide (TPR) repeat protein
MKLKRIYFFVFATLLCTSCVNTEKEKAEEAATAQIKQQLLNEIKNYEGQMHAKTQVDNAIANLAIKAYNDYAELLPNDSITPFYLFKVGEIATATQQYPQALAYYKKITESYLQFKYVKESLYLQGFLLDNYLNDDAKAKIIYKEVISKYPSTTFANDAKAAINNLGKTDEELIKEFKKKNND